MSSEWSFIIDGVKFSYSTLSGYENCNHSFKLSKIDAVTQLQNFFSDYGKLIHACYEEYFNDKIDSFELSNFYASNYDKIVVNAPPPFPLGMEEKYKAQGQLFFDFFSFDKSHYDVLMVEDDIRFEFHGSEFIAKPDLVLLDKNTGKTLLVDYKTAIPYIINKKTGAETPDKKKFESFYKQLYIYAYSIRTQRDIKIDEIMIWFPRMDRTITVDWNEEDENAAVQWMKDTIDKIRNDEVFDYNPSKFFCERLCGVREHCKYGNT
jgi:hypothetical protein